MADEQFEKMREAVEKLPSMDSLPRGFGHDADKHALVFCTRKMFDELTAKAKAHEMLAAEHRAFAEFKAWLKTTLKLSDDTTEEGIKANVQIVLRTLAKLNGEAERAKGPKRYEHGALKVSDFPPPSNVTINIDRVIVSDKPEYELVKLLKSVLEKVAKGEAAWKTQENPHGS